MLVPGWSPFGSSRCPKSSAPSFPHPTFLYFAVTRSVVASLETAPLASNRAAWCGGRRVHGGVVINTARLELAKVFRCRPLGPDHSVRTTSPSACAPLSVSTPELVVASRPTALPLRSPRSLSSPAYLLSLSSPKAPRAPFQRSSASS